VAAHADAAPVGQREAADIGGIGGGVLAAAAAPERVATMLRHE
jgi:hypothetical protein